MALFLEAPGSTRPKIILDAGHVTPSIIRTCLTTAQDMQTPVVDILVRRPADLDALCWKLLKRYVSLGKATLLFLPQFGIEVTPGRMDLFEITKYLYHKLRPQSSGQVWGDTAEVSPACIHFGYLLEQNCVKYIGDEPVSEVDQDDDQQQHEYSTDETAAPKENDPPSMCSHPADSLEHVKVGMKRCWNCRVPRRVVSGRPTEKFCTKHHRAREYLVEIHDVLRDLHQSRLLLHPHFRDLVGVASARFCSIGTSLLEFFLPIARCDSTMPDCYARPLFEKALPAWHARLLAWGEGFP